MEHGIFTYPWELADHGYDKSLHEIASAGFTNVNLAMQYHNGKFLLPRNPKRRVYYAEDGAISFRPDPSRYGVMKPRTHSLVTNDSSPADEVANRADKLGLNLVAWTVCLHNRWLGEQFPEAVQHTVFGDPLYNSLSPAHPLVREYLLNLITDMVSRYPIHAIQMESPGHMGFVHGEHHELIGTEFDAVQTDIMNLSFSDYEVQQATEAGIPAEILRGLTAAVMDASLNQGVKLAREDGSPTKTVESLINNGLPQYMVWLKQQEISLVTEIREAVQAISAQTQIWHFAALDGTPGDAALVAAGDGTLAGYAGSDEDAAQRAADAAQLGRSVRGAIRAIAPDTVDPAVIAQRKAAWERAGVTGIDVYNYGLMNGVIWNAVREAFGE
ncbi:MAG: family 10 glycosylhydrolase [Thermomicrobiales bacterium]|nr:family 10 glycosylhydrolase [Thermomicrobiales bacterium]